MFLVIPFYLESLSIVAIGLARLRSSFVSRLVRDKETLSSPQLRPNYAEPVSCLGVREMSCTRAASAGHQHRRAALQATRKQSIMMTMEGLASEVWGGGGRWWGEGHLGEALPMTKPSHSVYSPVIKNNSQMRWRATELHW